jgi:hypothetical protein
MPQLKKPKVLTRLKINEVSSVDAGAGDGCRVVLYKRDGTPNFRAIFQKHSRRPKSLQYLDRFANEDATVGRLTKRGGHLTSDEADERQRRAEMFNVRKMGDAAEPPPNIDDEAEFGESDNDEREQQDDDLIDEEGVGKSQVVSGLADLLCEAGASEGVTRADGLKWLLRDPRGNSLVRRLHKAAQTNKTHHRKRRDEFHGT